MISNTLKTFLFALFLLTGPSLHAQDRYVTSAQLHVSLTHNLLFDAYINGFKVIDSQDHLSDPVMDVSQAFTKDQRCSLGKENTLELCVHQVMDHSGKTNSMMGVAYVLQITLSDGTVLEIDSSDGGQTRRYHHQGFEPKGWLIPGFDDRSWSQAESYKPTYMAVTLIDPASNTMAQYFKTFDDGSDGHMSQTAGERMFFRRNFDLQVSPAPECSAPAQPTATSAPAQPLAPTSTFTAVPPPTIILVPTRVPSTLTFTAAPPTFTFTPVPPTATFTSPPAAQPTFTFTSVPPTATYTQPPVVVIQAAPPTATFTLVPPVPTNTPQPQPTATSAPVVPTNTPLPLVFAPTPLPTWTPRPLPPTATSFVARYMPPTATFTPFAVWTRAWTPVPTRPMWAPGVLAAPVFFTPTPVVYRALAQPTPVPIRPAMVYSPPAKVYYTPTSIYRAVYPTPVPQVYSNNRSLPTLPAYQPAAASRNPAVASLPPAQLPPANYANAYNPLPLPRYQAPPTAVPTARSIYWPYQMTAVARATEIAQGQLAQQRLAAASAYRNSAPALPRPIGMPPTATVVRKVVRYRPTPTFTPEEEDADTPTPVVRRAASRVVRRYAPTATATTPAAAAPAGGSGSIMAFANLPINFNASFDDGPGLYECEIQDRNGNHVTTCYHKQVAFEKEDWISWDATDDQGKLVKSGYYFAVFTKDKHLIKKIVLNWSGGGQ